MNMCFDDSIERFCVSTTISSDPAVGGVNLETRKGPIVLLRVS